MNPEMVAAAVCMTGVFVAQAALPSEGSLGLLTQLISALGPMGFVMWLVYRTTNHTIPRLAKGFEEAIEKQRVDFKEALKEQREDFMRTLDREREVCTKMLERVVRG